MIRTKNDDARPELGRPPAVLLLLAVVMAAAAGCTPAKPPSGTIPKGSPPPPVTIESNWGGYRVTVEPRTGTIPLNEPFDLRLLIERTPAFNAGSPVISGIDVAVDAEMPAHHHGMTRVPRVTRLAGGAYLAEGLLFHMPGHWQLYVDITEDGRTDRAEVGMDLQ